MGRRGKNKIKVPALTVCYPSSVSYTEGVQQSSTCHKFQFSSRDISECRHWKILLCRQKFLMHKFSSKYFTKVNGRIYSILKQRIYKQLESNVTVMLHLLHCYTALQKHNNKKTIKGKNKTYHKRHSSTLKLVIAYNLNFFSRKLHQPSKRKHGDLHTHRGK